uniref:Uncharacterized protein n=1 Tax=Triticum urartu TaxID=4572 RepID=A0A8R7UFZ6_TRIUA|eukprot:UN01050
MSSPPATATNRGRHRPPSPDLPSTSKLRPPLATMTATVLWSFSTSSGQGSEHRLVLSNHSHHCQSPVS